ncbi:MAG: hypothetical protein KGQ37_12955 [Hyphomicrobiales bacterium]|nr:hypothetical protein [Hyphomicrobiales bacterium]
MSAFKLPCGEAPYGHLAKVTGLALGLALATAAHANDLRVNQQGRLNVFTSLQTDQDNHLTLKQHGGRNLGGSLQYGAANTAITHQTAPSNDYGIGQYSLQNYSEAYQNGQGSHSNNAMIIQNTAQISGISNGNGPQVIINQTSHDADALSRQQYFNNGIVTFATVYHSGGVNITSITPFAPAIGVLGRAH